jgi:NADPH2:quinone reductase
VPRGILVSEQGQSLRGLVRYLPSRPPGPGEVAVDVRFSGVNFLDLYQVGGKYAMDLPFVPGREGAGIITSVGDEVDGFRAGDRVAFAMQREGSYSSEAIVDVGHLVTIPDTIGLEQAAGLVLQGVTAVFLVTEAAQLTAGDLVVVHSASGGTGSLVAQIAATRGARVAGVVSSDDKARRITDAGIVDSALLTEDWRSADWELRLGGRPATIFSAVGGDSVANDIARLARRGRLVVYGQTSGPIPPLDLSLLAPWALGVCYARISAYLAEPGAFARAARELFRLVEAGKVQLLELALLDLEEADQAHAILRDRAHVGKVVLRTSDG